MATTIEYLTQDGLDELGEGFDEHTPVILTDLEDAECRRLAEIARNPAVSRVVVNGRDWEGILCVLIHGDFEQAHEYYCVYSSGRVACHNVNMPQGFDTFAAYLKEA